MLLLSDKAVDGVEDAEDMFVHCDKHHSYHVNLTQGDTDPVLLGRVCVCVFVCWRVYHSFKFLSYGDTVLKIAGFPAVHLGCPHVCAGAERPQ